MFITRDLAPNIRCCYTVWLNEITGETPKLSKEDGLWDIAYNQIQENSLDWPFFLMRSYPANIFELLTGITLKPGGILEVTTITFDEKRTKGELND